MSQVTISVQIILELGTKGDVSIFVIDRIWFVKSEFVFSVLELELDYVKFFNCLVSIVFWHSWVSRRGILVVFFPWSNHHMYWLPNMPASAIKLDFCVITYIFLLLRLLKKVWPILTIDPKRVNYFVQFKCFLSWPICWYEVFGVVRVETEQLFAPNEVWDFYK